MNNEEGFKYEISRHVVTFKTEKQTVLARRDFLRKSFFSIEALDVISRLTIVTKGPTYSFDIPRSPEDLSDQINSLIADLG